MHDKANYDSTLKNSAQSKGVVGKASDALTGQKMPQRKTYKSMTGEEMLTKLAQKESKKRR